jgi:uncharacterized membrane protein YhaH (DUF805 family)
MNWRHLLFSFKGRASRSQYWTVVAITFPLLLLGAIADGAVGSEPLEGPGALFLFLVPWPFLAICAKRWHDRDKSAWWILIGIIPIVGDIWTFIENGYLKGTNGPNRFGADPVNGQV